MILDIEVGKGFVSIVVKDPKSNTTASSSFHSRDAVVMDLPDLLKELKDRINYCINILSNKEKK